MSCHGCIVFSNAHLVACRPPPAAACSFCTPVPTTPLVSVAYRVGGIPTVLGKRTARGARRVRAQLLAESV